jgi:hypothetical protein
MAESSSDLTWLWMAWSFFLPQLPFYLVWLIGMLLALLRWHRHPTASLLALLAFILFLTSSMVGTLLSVWVTSQMGNPDINRAWMYSLITLGRTVAGTVAWILLLLALFGWRTSLQPRPRPREDTLDTALPAVPDTGIREDRPG